MDKFENEYSFLDRVLHKLAFRSYGLQTILSSIEDDLFSKQISAVKIHKPVFITALPRAGTTLLLEMCVETQEFASHCYRDMPFVLTPMLWNSFSKSFQQTSELKERAHGDGMLVNIDSYEAFEEIIWKRFWKPHYKSSCINPWNREEESSDFEFFLQNHMRKIVALRSNNNAMRYISKNNLNIARLALLKRLFPDSVAIVPFRDPLQHATSLLRQHLNFVEMHNQDRFSQEYMEAIGHYDFGLNLRAINFDEWVNNSPYQDPTELSFWIEYWYFAYSHILKEANDNVFLLSFDQLCQNPKQILNRIADVICLEVRDSFLAQAPIIKQVKPYQIDTQYLSKDLVDKVNMLHSELLNVALH